MHKIRRFLKSLGPGTITGIADDDPSGIATYAQTGAIFGLQQLWLALYAIPFMVAVQEMCGRIGMVTGKGLAGVIKHHYSRGLLLVAVTLLVIANTVNIGADLGAMAQSVEMISPISFGYGMVLITLATVLAVVFIPYGLYVKILKYLALTVFAYVVTAFTLNHDWGEIFKATLIPHFEWNSTFILNVMAMLGTTISPYLFFWQASEEVEDEVEHHKIRAFGKGVPKVTRHDLAQMRSDTIVGMTISNMVTFFVIITAANVFGGDEKPITSALELASALEPLAGPYAVYLFAFGILGTGLLAIPVLAGSAAYAISETFSWKAGLTLSWRKAAPFYAVITVSLLVGALLNFTEIDPLVMLYYTAAINGILAAPILVIILLIANNKKILGERVNSWKSNLFGTTITIVMCVMAVFTVESFFR